MSKSTKFPMIRVTDVAKLHLEKLVQVKRAKGLSASGTAIVSELIISQPLTTEDEAGVVTVTRQE